MSGTRTQVNLEEHEEEFVMMELMNLGYIYAFTAPQTVCLFMGGISFVLMTLKSLILKALITIQWQSLVSKIEQQ